VPLTYIERTALAVGSGVMAYLNPRRADLIALFGETTAQPFFITRLHTAMLRSSTGRRILRDRPRLTSTTLSREYLESLPENSLGATYLAWLDREKVSPDTRAPVRYIDNAEEAYVMQRYRECHDFYHAITGMPTVREGEVALKLFEWMNTGLPMTGLSVLNVFTLKDAEKERFWEIYAPWAMRTGARCEELISVYWEEEMANDIDELRERLGIEVPEDMRGLRKARRDELKRQKQEAQA
jgi:ubiquinone biosynthesis protein COQ4